MVVVRPTGSADGLARPATPVALQTSGAQHRHPIRPREPLRLALGPPPEASVDVIGSAGAGSIDRGPGHRGSHAARPPRSGASWAAYGLGMRDAAVRMACVPSLRPISASSPAAWSAVPSRSAPLGAPVGVFRAGGRRLTGPGALWSPPTDGPPTGSGRGSPRRRAPARSAPAAVRPRRSSAAWRPASRGGRSRRGSRLRRGGRGPRGPLHLGGRLCRARSGRLGRRAARRSSGARPRGHRGGVAVARGAAGAATVRPGPGEAGHDVRPGLVVVAHRMPVTGSSAIIRPSSRTAGLPASRRPPNRPIRRDFNRLRRNLKQNRTFNVVPLGTLGAQTLRRTLAALDFRK